MSFRSVSFSPYSLGMRSGALLRFEFDKGYGYSDCHPWSELGDAPLALQLEGLKNKNLTPLLARSVHFAKVDCEYRSSQQNCLENKPQLRSHKLITHLHLVSNAELDQLRNDGFRELKIKLGRNREAEISKLNELFAKDSSWLLRFDFNAALSLEEFRNFFSKLSSNVTEKIEFIEDPISGPADEWFELQDEIGITLARDFAKVENQYAHYFVRVIKPAVQVPIEVAMSEPESVELVVTSYLDHPLGQMCAAYEAAILNEKFPDRVLAPGLLHHSVYEPNDYSRQIQANQAKLLPAVGTGFGFDDLLEKEDWKLL